MRGAIYATALVAGFPAALPVAAKGGFEHKLVQTLRLETGEVIESSFLGVERSQCLRDLKRVEIGRVIPRGAMVFPGGKTYAATITGAKCVMTDRKN